FGTLKKKWWDLGADIREPIMMELEKKFDLLFTTLRVGNTTDIVGRTVKPVIVSKDLPENILGS
ncbi:MAG: hypothetical protein P8Z71_11770, partial [Candidatus Sulfobium sp.]